MSEERPDTEAGGELSRRDLLAKASVLGAGAIAAGSLAGGAAASQKYAFATPKIRRGGRLVFGLESDPVAVAPYGMAPGAAHWGKEHTYDSLAEFDKGLNIRPALATSWKYESKKSMIFNLRKGVKFHNGKELTADDVVYSFKNMKNPPPPGSAAVAANVPGTILSAEAVSKYVVRFKLSAPDARIVGFFAWQRYGPIVPEGLYDQINVSRNAIGTGPYKMVGFNPLDRVELVRNDNFWKTGQPYMDAMTLKVMTDEQSRVSALRAGAIDGATLSVDTARSLKGVSNLQVLSNLNAAFRELQMSLKPGKNEPWADPRVRQAVNFAINRQQIIQTVYSGEAAYTSYVPPGYGPWPLTDAQLRQKFAKFDLPNAKKLMAAAGASKGFSVDDDDRRPPGLPLGGGVARPADEADQHRPEHQEHRDRDVRRALLGGELRLVPQRPRHAWRRRRLRAGVPPGLGDVPDPDAGVQEPQGLEGHRQRAHRAQRQEAAADVQGRAGTALAQPDPDAACRDPQVPGVQQARAEHVRGVQRLQHRPPHGLAELVTAGRQV